MAAITGSILFYSMSCLVLLICTMLFIAKSFSVQVLNSGTKPRTPPSPPALPVIGHLHLVGSVIPKSFQNLARLYGPLMQLRLGASKTLIVSNAQVAGEVYKTHELNFCYRPEFGSSDHDTYTGSYFITAPYGLYWRFMKKLCVTQLLSTSQLGRFTHVRDQEVKNLLDSLLQCSREAKACDLSLKLTSLTNNILCRTAMSTTCDAEHIYRLVRGCLELGAKLSLGEVLGPLAKFDLFGYGRKVAKVKGELDQILETIMEEHEKELSHKTCEEEERKDMMDILLQVYKDPNAEVKLKRNDLKAFFLEILLAGTDTTSVALQWAMAEIINHPGVLNRLREEMDSMVGTRRLVKESDVPNLPYLRAVVKEVLRLHPSAPFALRQSAEDCSINGYDVKGQTRTLVNVYAIMRDPQVWPNPEEFLPERFLEGNAMEMKGQDLSYVPFGSGRRGCPGASFALTVMHSTIAALIQCFDWKVKGGTKVDTTEGSGFSVGLAKPLVCYPITRLDLFSV
ncbi:3,9-dihydroxypterocarpan 6A-monooxygenase-like [Neltuma alba]|uniref:3,9-dihydroxypterocarpan 6A-monooxygenase-like n=1 Tax=Neltuma alba TaxID=207710 RepID=UPI0010A55B5F|nr:3,9-dihydroxypterocarpan 6A-monooxygenase-like [Prosopis alba]